MALKKKKASKDPRILKRYTSMAPLIHMLQTQTLTFLSPATWDDKNDAFYMDKYQEAMSLDEVRALCFSTKAETYHHWKIFAGGIDGVCIEFQHKKLIESLGSIGIRHGRVSYLRLNEVVGAHIRAWDLPFRKRYAFGDEEEYRIILQSDAARPDFNASLPLDIKAIDRITVSPWLPEPMFQAIKKTIRSVRGCSDLNVRRTSLISNTAWKQAADRIL